MFLGKDGEDWAIVESPLCCGDATAFPCRESEGTTCTIVSSGHSKYVHNDENVSAVADEPDLGAPESSSGDTSD